MDYQAQVTMHAILCSYGYLIAFYIGYRWAKRQARKEKQAEDVRLATTNTIGGGWISVLEGMPEPNQCVLIDWQGDCELVQYITESDGGYFWDSGITVFQSTEIDHWRLLPNTPTS